MKNVGSYFVVCIYRCISSRGNTGNIHAYLSAFDCEEVLHINFVYNHDHTISQYHADREFIIGFPFLRANKEILQFNVTIFPCILIQSHSILLSIYDSTSVQSCLKPHLLSLPLSLHLLLILLLDRELAREQTPAVRGRPHLLHLVEFAQDIVQSCVVVVVCFLTLARKTGTIES